MLVSVNLKDMNSLLIKMSPSSATSSMAPPPATLPGLSKHEPEIKEQIYESTSHVGPHIDIQLSNKYIIPSGNKFQHRRVILVVCFYWEKLIKRVVEKKNSQLK